MSQDVERRCAACNKPLVRRRNESPAEFERRHSCNQICGYRARGIETERLAQEQRYCCVCGGLIVRRDGELAYKFIRRRTCGKSQCRGTASWDNMAAKDTIPWPRLNPKPVPDFRRHNLATKDGFVAKIAPNDNQSYTGCTAAWCVDVA